MQNKSSHLAVCESEAAKIQFWFGKDREMRLGTHAFALPKELSKAYKCDLVKTPRLPAQVEYIPFYGYNLSKKKRSTKPRIITTEAKSSYIKIPLEKTPCSVNQKYPHALSHKAPLSSERVISWHLKEHFFVSKRLKLLSRQIHSGPRWQEVVLIHVSEKKDTDPSTSYLEEWKGIRKDREFPVTRITT